MNRKIRRALISVFDKKGALEFARSLHGLDVEILSTGGTAEMLRKAGLPVTEVSQVTQFPEMLDGRVKTLHPRLHAGILARRSDPAHMRTLKEHGIQPIDLVVVNLYPFAETVRSGASDERTIEMIDIGGPSMLRAAAKNFADVAAVCDPSDYEAVGRELIENGGALRETTRRRLASKVFERTAAYDAEVSAYFLASRDGAGSSGSAGQMPSVIELSFKKAAGLRYGENPHQRGALYQASEGASGVARARQLHGKELSFNNILDLDAALEMAMAFTEPACSVVKHTSPCGFALGRDAASAFLAAHRCDPLSAFGSIVGLNCAVDERAAKSILASGFIECVIAPSFSKEALELLKSKKNLRLLTVPVEKPESGFDYKKVRGGLLVQDRDLKDPSARDLKTVTRKKPTAAQIKDMLFAFKVSRYVKSNAIVIASKGVTVGLGMGQPSRVDSCMTAFRKAGKRSRGAVMASDGFFPKPDSIALAKRHGIKAIIQPGGSIQDPEVIRACDRAGIAMVFAGVRHFRH